jgi:succinate-semialdehyde dehydrogenase/glutarate-semialdehyde dehydrogenase
MTLEVINPATGNVEQGYDEMSAAEVRTRITAAHHAYQSWRRTTFTSRAELMREAANVLRSNAREYAVLMATEMGKPVRDGLAEVEKCAWACEYYADEAAPFLAPEIIETAARKSFVTFQPLGVIFAVMPWNFPFWQVFRFLAPSLMAGNSGLLKHAANVPGCALAIEDVLQKAGFPDNLFQTLLITNRQAASVIRHRHVTAVTLTGSTGAGQAVAKIAGSKLKKTVLELGGSDPYVILEDADLAATVETCVTSRLINAGQSCIAAKRFVVVESKRADFERAFVERMRITKPGDPLDDATTMGPLARGDLRDSLHDQVTRSVEKGARCLLGGKVPSGRGAYYPPTVLTDVRKGMPAYNEELFGPVAAIIPVQNERQAIRVANDSVFGLGAAVFTNDLDRGERIATTEIEAGACFVNTFVKSDPRLPFGGIKESGYGRELSHYGIKEFVNVKTVYIA